ncbi:MAG: glycosyltransferase family 4 protein [Planctomycetes bacterium]|nr:glycosyltransferase family 4 protein [Planctomycetota bacterium]
MRIAQLTPGAGGGFYCENCLRDGALVRAMGKIGHDIVLVPMYLPTGIGSTAGGTERVFYGGINVYLQQKLGLFRHTPRWLDRLFDSPRLLGWAASRASMTSSADLADTTISMLKGEEGRQVKELKRLVQWLDLPDNRPDVVVLSNVMLIGLARFIKERLGAKVVCLLQDEADFLDTLGEGFAAQAWEIIARRCIDVDCFVSVSEYYAGVMRKRLGLESDRVRVVYTGIDLDGYAAVSPWQGAPAIGFLSQMCDVKGLDVLVDAFLQLKSKEGLEDLQLRIAGGQSAADERFITALKSKLEAAGVLSSVDFLKEFDKAAKLEFFGSISVLCVPEKNSPAYGLYVLEAGAAAVPVVQPEIGVFAELIDITGGGRLYLPNTVKGLVSAVEPLLRDPEMARQVGAIGRENVFKKFDIDCSATELANISTELCGEKK